MDRRAAVSVALLAVVAFVTIAADGCNEALDTWSPEPPMDTMVPAPPDASDGGAAASGDQALSVETPSAEAAGTADAAVPSATATPAFTGEEVTLFSNTDDGPIRDGAVGPATVVLDAPTLITYVQTYHWHGGRGAAPGTITITGPDGTVYGPWEAAGTDGQGGVRNAYWEVRPRVVLEPGTYLVDDSDAATRGTNDAMGGIGQTIVRGIPAAP